MLASGHGHGDNGGGDAVVNNNGYNVSNAPTISGSGPSACQHYSLGSHKSLCPWGSFPHFINEESLEGLENFPLCALEPGSFWPQSLGSYLILTISCLEVGKLVRNISGTWYLFPCFPPLCSLDLVPDTSFLKQVPPQWSPSFLLFLLIPLSLRDFLPWAFSFEFSQNFASLLSKPCAANSQTLELPGHS